MQEKDRNNILCVVPSYFPASKFGGPIQALRSLNLFLSKNGLNIEVVTTNAGLEINPEYSKKKTIKYLDGIKTTYFSRIKLFDIFNSSGWHFSIPLCLYIIKESKNFDIIYCRSIWNFPTIAAYLAAKIHKKKLIIAATGKLTPWVWSQMTLKKYIYWWFIAKPIVHSSFIHYVSQEEVDLCHDFHGFSNKPLIIKTGTDKFYDDNRKEKTNLAINLADSKTIKLLFMGRIHHMKGIDILIDLFGELIEDKKDVSLIIAGPKDGKYFETIETLISNKNITSQKVPVKDFLRNSLKNKITFTGLVEGDEKNWLYSISDIYCHFSRNEGFSNSIIEAMAFSKPVLISEGCYFGDAKNSKFGDVFKNLDEAKNKINRLILNDDLREEMGKYAFNYIEQNHEWDAISKSAVDDINSLINKI